MRYAEKMRDDWNKRAEADPFYWVYNVHGHGFDDIEACYEIGRREAVEMVSTGLRVSGMEPHGKTFLEIGCGLGRLFKGFAELRFGQIKGVDVSPAMIRLGKAYCPVEGASFHLVNGVRLDGIESESIDYCFSYNVFQTFPDKEVVWSNLREISRVLRLGGWLQLHYRGKHAVKQEVLHRMPRRLRTPVYVLYGLSSLKWLRGKRLLFDDPADPRTCGLGVAVPPQEMSRQLKALGFQGVTVLPDPAYGTGGYFWALARKGPMGWAGPGTRRGAGRIGGCRKRTSPGGATALTTRHIP